MPATLKNSVVVAMSPRALFGDMHMPDLSLEDGAFQLPPPADPQKKRATLPWLKDTLGHNNGACGQMTGKPVEVVLLSKDKLSTLPRASRKMRDHELSIERGIYTGGLSTTRLLAPMNAALYISSDPHNVQSALEEGYRAVQATPRHQSFEPDQTMPIAADGHKEPSPPPPPPNFTIAASPRMLSADADILPGSDDEDEEPYPLLPPSAQNPDEPEHTNRSALPFLRKMLALNGTEGGQVRPGPVQITVLTKASPSETTAIHDDIAASGLPPLPVVCTNGRAVSTELPAIAPQLYLTSHRSNAHDALAAEFPGVHIVPHTPQQDTHPNKLILGYDYDGCIADDQPESVFAHGGLAAFQKQELSLENVTHGKGPLHATAKGLNDIKTAQIAREPMQMTDGLITSRSFPSETRALHSLNDWDIKLDFGAFLGGLPKAPFLQALEVDIFFDDQKGHVDTAASHVAVGHVPYGIRNADMAVEDEEAAHRAVLQTE